MATNSRPVGVATTEPNGRSWDALDRLPGELRRLVWEAPESINPISVDELVQFYGSVDGAAARLLGAINAEIAAFAVRYHQSHGHPLPHIAAGVSRQAYELPGRIRRNRPLSAASWRRLRRAGVSDVG